MIDSSEWSCRSFCQLVSFLAIFTVPAIMLVQPFESPVPFVALKSSRRPTAEWLWKDQDKPNTSLRSQTEVTQVASTTLTTTCSLPSSASFENGRPRVTTIYVSAVYGWPPVGPLQNCSVPCNIIRDETSWHSADVIVWNVRWMTGSPERMGANLQTKPRNQRWVANYDFEAPTSENRRFMALIGKGVDWTASFETRSDFFKPLNQLVPEKQETFEERNFAAGKDKLLLWFVSNCGAKTRQNIFSSIKSYLPAEKVTQYGSCAGGVRGSCRTRNNITCMQEVTRPYKFYAAFENNRCNGYITEKFFRGYEYGMVPIAWGGLGRADYEKVAPGDSFIHVDDFKDHKALADYLLKLDADDASYNRYFAWQKDFRLTSMAETRDNVTCQLCKEAQKPIAERKPSRGDWNKHFFGRCKPR